MIPDFFLSLVLRTFGALTNTSVVFDLHIDNNNYLLAALYYMRALDQFLPITDVVLPLVATSFLIQNGLTAFRIFRFVKSFIPAISGSG